MTGTAAIVGTGFVGRAWAIAFARAGWRARMWDADPSVPEAARGLIGELLPELAKNGLLGDASPADVAARLEPCRELETALDGVDWVQESAPERVEVKQALFRDLDRLAPDSAVIGSSTSSIRPSLFTGDLPGRRRCLVVHPINPPYLIPATELVPAPWTAPETVERAREVMLAIGQSPIAMARELDCFVVNRLQGALLEEAFRLVDDGFCGAEDVDRALRDGLALRWSLIGPFETIDLNAPRGIRDYVARYEGMYAGIHEDQKRRVDWSGPVMDRIETERRARLPESAIPDRIRWRDRRLMALMAHMRKARTELGD
jgi:L-gulonate 3-dehydrogenase